MKQFSKLLKTLAKRKIVIIASVLLIVLLLLYKSDTVMIDKPKQIAEYIYGKTNLDFFPLWSKITGSLFRLEDEINFFKIKKNLFDGELPIYDLSLNPNTLRYLDNVSKASVSRGYLSSDINKWKPAKLNINGEIHDVKIKLHGDAMRQWADDLKSYKIKAKSYDYINNIRNFNLILFEDRMLRGKITRILAKELGLMDIRDDIVVLRINGVVQGVYYLQERLDYNFLEYNQCSSCEIIRNKDNFIEDHPYGQGESSGIFWSSAHRTPFDYTLANIDLDESDFDKEKILYKAYRLFEVVENGDTRVIDFFDIEQLSSFEVLRMMMEGGAESVTGDNLILAYSATNSKFYPIPINEACTKLKLEKGGLEHHLNKYGDYFVDLFYLLSQNDELRYRRNKKIYQLTLNNNFSKEIDNIVNRYLPYTLSYKTNNYNTRFMRHEITDLKRIIQHNMALVKKNLEYSKVYINAIEKDNKITLEVIPDSIAELKFNELKIKLTKEYSGRLVLIYNEGQDIQSTNSILIENKTDVIDLMSSVRDLYFSAGLDDELYPKKRTYKLEIVFDNSDKVSINETYIKMRNDITNKEIDQLDTYIQIVDSNDNYASLENFSFTEFKNKYSEFRWHYTNDRGELTLLKGDYALYEDLVIPEVTRFTIEAGVRISIAEDKSLLSYIPTNILGTKDQPVIVSALDKDKPFGTFAILGDGKNESKSVINWFDISGGNEKWINGVYFSGQLSIYHMNVDMSNSVIHGSYSDDGLNIKYSNILIDNCRFHESSTDQVDLDFVTGTVKNSEFDGIGDGDINGDSLDISGSKVLLKNNVFFDSPDKGVSIGEETKAILYKNRILDNNMGVAVKDLSHVYLVENTFKNNNIAVNSYQKKQLFGGGFSYSYNNEYVSNGEDYSKDNNSKNYKISFTEERYNRLVETIDKESLNSLE